MSNLVPMSAFLCLQGSVQGLILHDFLMSSQHVTDDTEGVRSEPTIFGGTGVLPREFFVTTPSRLA